MDFQGLSEKRIEQIAKGITAFLIVVTAFFVIKGINEIKRSAYIDDEVPTQNTINVSAEGEVFVVPDIAEFSFTVTEEASSVKEAQDSVTERSNNIVSFLKDNDVKEKDIKTTGYNVHPRYEYQERRTSFPSPPQGERVLVGYEVSQTTQVKVRETDKVGELLSGVGEKGVSNVSNISFTVEDESEVREEARAKAITKAKEKAKRLADQLDVSLGDVVSFHESGDQPRFLYDKATVEGRGGGDDGAPTPEISPGENRVISNVNITYEIR